MRATSSGISWISEFGPSLCSTRSNLLVTFEGYGGQGRKSNQQALGLRTFAQGSPDPLVIHFAFM